MRKVKDLARVETPEPASTARATASDGSVGESAIAPELEHADDCDCVNFGACGDNRGWVVHADWDDADVCTCYLKAVMERRAIYGDERLVGDLPL